MSLDSAPALTSQEKTFTVIGMLLAMFLAALDQTVVATAGPAIMKSLEMAPGLYSWLTTAYLVASTVLVPVYGKLSDLYGRRRIVLVGVTLFLAASVGCGLSTTTWQLFVFRALQGAGSASIFTSAFAVVADLFSPRERGRYSGLFGAVFGISSLVGPLLGGFITDTWGWSWVFFINLPVGVVALAFIALRMPALKPVGVSTRLDWVGAALLALGVVPLLIGLSLGRPELRAGDVGLVWGDPVELGLLGGGVVGVALFVWWELRASAPLVDLRSLRDPTVRWSNLAVFVMGGVFLTPTVFLPLFMVNVVGVTATASGLTISPLILGVVAGNVLSGQLVSKLGRYKELLLAGLVLLTLGFTVMAFTLTAGSTQREVTVKMVLLGLGLGPSIPLYTLAVQNAVEPRALGVATSMVTFFRQMGAAVGLAVIGSFFASTLSGALRDELRAAMAGLPPALAERFSASAPAVEGRVVDAQALRAQALAQLEGAKTVAKKAVSGDALAAALVAQSGMADERLTAIARAGGVRVQVQRSFESMRARVEAAAQSEAAWLALQRSSDLPSEVRGAVAQGSVKDPLGRANALALVRPALEAAEKVAEEKAQSQAMAQLEATFAALSPKVLAAVDAVGQASKLAITAAIRRVFELALGLTLFTLLVTFLLPRLALRSRAPSSSLAAEAP